MENKKEKRQGAAPGYDKEGERLEKQMCPPAGTKFGKGKKEAGYSRRVSENPEKFERKNRK